MAQQELAPQPNFAALSQHIAAAVNEVMLVPNMPIANVNAVLNQILEQNNQILASVQQLQGDVRQLKGDMRQVQGDVRQLKGDMRQVQGDVRQLKGDMRQVQGDVRQLQQGMEEIRLENARLLPRLFNSKAARTVHLQLLPARDGQIPVLNPITEADVMQMDAQGIGPYLRAYELPVRGTIEEKRARLLNFLGFV
eukprot:JZ549476.1.p1 GENE.JZ549476.1~~JZ549476.1.p1  ORF type:complete len:195 (+),score=7.40 JZ549476.1:63-647(+)